MKNKNFERECFDELYKQIEVYRTPGAAMDIFGRCLVTAFRVIKGDSVSPRDNRALFENYPGMHYKVWSLRTDLENQAAC